MIRPGLGNYEKGVLKSLANLQPFFPLNMYIVLKAKFSTLVLHRRQINLQLIIFSMGNM